MARVFYDELERLEMQAWGGRPTPTGRWGSVDGAPGEGYRALRTLSTTAPSGSRGAITVVTGAYGARVIEPVRERLERLCGRSLRILAVANDFFGGNVAVSGLVVGDDLERALVADSQPPSLYLLPDVMLSGDRFLDDRTLLEVAASASAPVLAVPTSVAGLLEGACR